MAFKIFNFKYDNAVSSLGYSKTKTRNFLLNVEFLGEGFFFHGKIHGMDFLIHLKYENMHKTIFQTSCISFIHLVNNHYGNY